MSGSCKHQNDVVYCGQELYIFLNKIYIYIYMYKIYIYNKRI